MINLNWRTYEHSVGLILLLPNYSYFSEQINNAYPSPRSTTKFNHFFFVYSTWIISEPISLFRKSRPSRCSFNLLNNIYVGLIRYEESLRPRVELLPLLWRLSWPDSLNLVWGVDQTILFILVWRVAQLPRHDEQQLFITLYNRRKNNCSRLDISSCS